MYQAVLLAGIHAFWTIPTALLSRLDRSSSGSAQFEVHSIPGLPENSSLPTSWAGRLPVPNVEDGNALFFWLFQTEDIAYDHNLISMLYSGHTSPFFLVLKLTNIHTVWLNGGPGCSSLAGLTMGNGPISFVDNTTKLQTNPYSWTKLGHVLYIDQPVGAGYSTASKPYPARNLDRITSDFHAWLHTFFSRFPRLRQKHIHLIGESFAGYYIPYFASAIVANQDSLPLALSSLSMGNPTLGDPTAMFTTTIVPYLASQQATLNIPDDIMAAFSEADKICGFDAITQQTQTFPYKSSGPISIPDSEPPSKPDPGNETCFLSPSTADDVLSSALNATSCQGSCDLAATAMNYIRTLKATREKDGRDCYDIYDVTNGCDSISAIPLINAYFNRADVQTALNLPFPSSSSRSSSSSSYSVCNEDILETLTVSGPLPEPPAYSVLPELVNVHRLPVHVFSGANDMLLNHFGTELVLQNMTWNGAFGFSQRPDRVFYVDDAAPSADHAANGTTAGTWGEERGLSYHLFYGAGHTVFQKKSREMFAFVRDVVVGRLST